MYGGGSVDDGDVAEFEVCDGLVEYVFFESHVGCLVKVRIVYVLRPGVIIHVIGMMCRNGCV